MKPLPQRILLLLLIWGCALVVGRPFFASAEPEKTIIYFYSPEANINKFKLLKIEFDTYLAQFGHYEFQPYSDKATFERDIKNHTSNALVLLSSWHFREIQTGHHLTQIFVGERNGKTSQKRILVTATESAMNLDRAKTETIASVGSEEYIQNTLQEIFVEKLTEEAVKIFPVPKDIDALLAVGYGLAQAALVTENSFSQLKTANPKLYREMKIIGEGQEALLLILAVPERFTEGAQEMSRIIAEMATNPAGKEKLNLLGLDGWQKADLSDKLNPEN